MAISNEDFDSDYLDALVAQAKAGVRLRQHLNIHQSYDDPSQCLLNAVEPHSYIRPHRHLSDLKTRGYLLLEGSWRSLLSTILVT